MKKLLLIIIPVLLAIGGYMAWEELFHQTEEERVEARLKEVCRLSSKYAGDSASAGLLKAHAIGKLFDDKCKLDLQTHFSGSYTPAEISSNAMRYRTRFKYAVINIYDLEIKIQNPAKALAEFTVSFDGLTKQGKRVNEYRELKCELRKSNGKWIICRITLRQILEK